ncbi:MAG: hypothetical protein N2645_21050 [Clostridia bacterium]|nr:hypothetical protein [Clostridia bacterium]
MILDIVKLAEKCFRYSNTVRSDYMPQATNLPDGTLPEWVYKSIYSKLDNPGLLDKKNITMQKCFNPITERSQIIAYANANRNDGAIIIFEDFDGKYKEVFSEKLRLILSVQTHHPDIIMVCMDESGTGTATVNFHIIRYTKNGYRNVWQGLADYFDNNYSPQLRFEVTAGISFSNTGELIHSIFKKLYKEGNATNPVSIEKLFDIYVYNDGYMQYQFVKRL